MKILMVLTSHDQLGNTGRKTGFWLEEFAAPYYVFRDAGVHLTLASPKGGQPPIDPKSDLPENQTPAMARFKQDRGGAKGAVPDIQAVRYEFGGLRHDILRGRPRSDVGPCRQPRFYSLDRVFLQFRQAGRCGLPFAGRAPSGDVQGRSNRKRQACHWLHQRRRGGSSPHQCRALPC